jgi:hypothetical protein
LEKTIDVFSNDPKTPKFQLKLTGTVELIADFEPNRLNLKNVLKGGTVTETVKVVAKEPEKLQLSELVVSDPESLKAEVVKGDNGAPAVKVTFIGGDKERHFSGRITAKTNLETLKEIELFVYGMVTSDLVLDRTYAFFGNFDAKNPPTFPIKVSSISGKPFVVKKIEDESGAVTGTIEKKDKDTLVTLKLTKDINPPRGKLRLLTDRKDQASIEVSYSVRLPGPAASNIGGTMVPQPKDMGKLQFQPGNTKGPLKPIQMAPLRKLPLKGPPPGTEAVSPPKPPEPSK